MRTQRYLLLRLIKLRDRIHEGIRGDKKSYWLQPKDYEEFKNNWGIIGDGYE